VCPRRLEIGARGERERAQVRQAADAHAREARAVEGAPPRAGDGGVERRDQAVARRARHRLDRGVRHARSSCRSEGARESSAGAGTGGTRGEI